MGLVGSKKTKFLIIHGFGGGVDDVKPLAQYLNSLGYDAVCPVLKGHAGTKEDMKKTTYNEWIDSAEHELLSLQKEGDEILLMGFSMGGLIAFNLASKYNIKGIVTINTPIYYWNMKQVTLNLADDIKNKKRENIRRYIQAKNNTPIYALIQFQLLLHKTKPKLEKITCPILMIQAEDDDTVRRKSVDYINMHVSSNDKTIRYFQEGGHLILLSPVAEKAIFCIEDFLRDRELF